MAGLLLVVVAITLQACSNGLLSGHVNGTESLLLSVIAFSASALVFGVLARLRSTPRRTRVRGPALRLMVLLNVATAVTFLGFYWSLSVIPAPLASAVETGVGPLALACARIRTHRRNEQARRPAAETRGRPAAEVGFGVLALLLALCVAGRMGASSAGRHHSPAMLAVGILVTAIAGCSAAAIAAISHRLGQLQVSPTQVMAHRYHLTYVLALAALLSSGGPVASLTGSQVAFITTLALLGAALPLFVLQIGMQRTPPLTVAMLASAVPGLTYLAAAIAGNQRFDVASFALINASIGLAFLGPIVLTKTGPNRHGSVLTPKRPPADTSPTTAPDPASAPTRAAAPA